MLNDDETKYYLYVGFGVSKSSLKINGEKLEFNTARERIEFRKILSEERPKTIHDIKILYEVFI